MIPESINLEFKANNRKRSKPLDIEASFLFPYFSKGMSKYNEDLSEYETKSDKRCRDWVLAFKDLSELGEESAKNLNELRIFKYICAPEKYTQIIQKILSKKIINYNNFWI